MHLAGAPVFCVCVILRFIPAFTTIFVPCGAILFGTFTIKVLSIGVFFVLLRGSQWYQRKL